MLCCLLSALMAGNIAVAGRIVVAHRGVVASAGLVVAAVIALATAPALVEHAGHYAARAAANDRSILEELMAQPLCSGPDTTLASVAP